MGISLSKAEAFDIILNKCLDNIRGVFTQDELLVFLELSNGLFLTPGLLGEHLSAEIEDMDAEVSGLDKKQLLNKLNTLHVADRCSLEIWCRMFWEMDSPLPPNSYIIGEQG